MKTYPSEAIKNVMLAGHGGSGKTSLAEALLFYNKSTDRLGKVADGNTVMDSDPEEIKRLSSMSLSMSSFEAKDRKINLLDAPGSFDFAGGMYEGVQAAGTVLIVVSGKSGVTPGAEIAYELAVSQGKSVAFFVSKIDSESADFNKCFRQLREKFGVAICPVVIPHVVNHKVEAIVNVLHSQAYAYDGKGNSHEIDLPEGLELLDEARQTLQEAIAETSDEYMEKFFAGEEFTADEIRNGLNLGIAANKLIPVFCGSSTTLEGIDHLTHYMAVYFPSAVHKAVIKGTDEKGETTRIPCDPNGPLAVHVFKTVADPFIGKLSYVKVLRGKLTADASPVNSRTGEPERIGKIIFLKGKKQEDAKEVVAGDIAALAKLGNVQTGDILCAPDCVVKVPMSPFPNPTMGLAISAKNKGDEGKIAGALQRLCEEDLTLSYTVNNETHEQVITGLGDQHLDMVISKLKSKFGLDVETWARERLIDSISAYPLKIRERLEDVRREMLQFGGDPEEVRPDHDEAGDRFDALTEGKVTTLLKLWKDGKTGTVWGIKTVQGAVVRPAWDTEQKLYPIVWMSWDVVPNCYHGQAAVTGLIPNQIFVNKMFAMTMISLMTTAYPKVIYDKTRIGKWDSGVGKAIGVDLGSGSIGDVAKTIDPAVISPQVSQFIELAISMTKEFMGATDAALGNVRPDNTSAIIALQKASQVPMELTKQDLYQCIEDLAAIWLDLMQVYYGERFVEMPLPKETQQAMQQLGAPATERAVMPFDFAGLDRAVLSLKLDVGGSAYWSEIAQINTLDNLLSQGRISVVDYLERIPNGYISNQQELIEKLKAKEGVAALAGV